MRSWNERSSQGIEAVAMDMWQSFMESTREALETLKATEPESGPFVEGWNQSLMFQATKSGEGAF
jgi:hypothetical protein